jgi:hypothetical protein
MQKGKIGFDNSLLAREINWLETGQWISPEFAITAANFSLLAREINWLETQQK